LFQDCGACQKLLLQCNLLSLLSLPCLGEAIAFALGGNRKMLRASSLASLLNHEVKAAGGRAAQVRGRLGVQMLQNCPAGCC